jgi:ABC-type transport system substrate-binding protein
VVRGYLPQPPVVATDIQAQLGEVGIDVTVEEVESGTFIGGANAGQYELLLLGWGMDFPDPTNFLDAHFGSGAADTFGDKFEDITTPLAAAAQLADPDARYPLYVEANTAVRDEVPMVPIAHGGNGAAYQARILGAHAQSVGQESLALMEDPDDDNIIFMQNGEPITLYCADESDGETFRACEQFQEGLLDYEIGSGNIMPGLAESYDVNDTLTEWTFHLRDGVKFHDGSDLDANDVVESYAVQWDAANPLHVGNTGQFVYFTIFFTQFLNPPPAE